MYGNELTKMSIEMELRIKSVKKAKPFMQRHIINTKGMFLTYLLRNIINSVVSIRVHTKTKNSKLLTTDLQPNIKSINPRSKGKLEKPNVKTSFRLYFMKVG
jgi:hypothetical protein